MIAECTQQFNGALDDFFPIYILTRSEEKWDQKLALYILSRFSSQLVIYAYIRSRMKAVIFSSIKTMTHFHIAFFFLRSDENKEEKKSVHM